MSRGHKGVRQPPAKQIVGPQMEVNNRTPQDLINDLREFQVYLDKIGAGAPRCIAEGCSKKVIRSLDPYYCMEHRPRL